jgi:outer membrane biosynthesis protein TonB
LLESPVFLLGIGGDGSVQFVLLQQSSGDDAADRLVEQTLKRLAFKGGQSETQWSTATFIWGNPPAE